jgi:hypothetical protein
VAAADQSLRTRRHHARERRLDQRSSKRRRYVDVFVPPPSATEPTSAQGDFLDQPVEVAYNADVEPDADQDGYGDETQDLCPTSATTALPCPVLA